MPGKVEKYPDLRTQELKSSVDMLTQYNHSKVGGDPRDTSKAMHRRCGDIQEQFMSKTTVLVQVIKY